MSALYVVNQGEEALLDLMLAIGYTMRLYRTDVTVGLTSTQINALTETSFTEATFTGYAAKTLTGGSWVTTQQDPSTGVYAQQTFTSTAVQSQTIYGYYITRTSDGKLQWFERFTGPITITANGDTVVITPTITLEDDQEASVAARGIVAFQALTTNSPAYSASGFTDFTISNVVTDSTRAYRVELHSSGGITGSARWITELWVDGVQTDRVGDIDAASQFFRVDKYSALWFPTTGTHTLQVKANLVGGTGNLDFAGDPAFPRHFWVEDIGPR